MTARKDKPVRRWAAVLTAAVLLGAVVTAAVLVLGQRPLARIGDSPVGEEEFLLVLRENLVQYETALRQEGTLPEGQTLHDFVQTDEGADAVLELQWQQLALQRAKCSLAVEYSVAEEYSFEDLKQHMNEENASRIAKLQNRQHWTMWQYYTLGKLTHYLADAFTYPHNENYPESLLEHRHYEDELRQYLASYLENCSLRPIKARQDVIAAIDELHRQYMDTVADMRRDVQYILRAVNLLMASCVPAAA